MSEQRKRNEVNVKEKRRTKSRQVELASLVKRRKVTSLNNVLLLSHIMRSTQLYSVPKIMRDFGSNPSLLIQKQISLA